MSLLDDDDLQIGTKVVVRSFWRRLGFALMAAFVAAFIGGFVVFAGALDARSYNLANVAQADGIVVLTGGADRLYTAYGLLQGGKGQRLLITGVGQGATKADLRGQLGAEDAPSDTAAPFNCCIDLDYSAQDTVGNAGASAKWAGKQGYDSLIVVTSAYHMPRTLIEMGRAMPDKTLTPLPVQSAAVPLDAWWTSPGTAMLIFGEYLRTGVAFARAEFDKVRQN